MTATRVRARRPRIGSRIVIYWEDDELWYEAVVQREVTTMNGILREVKPDEKHGRGFAVMHEVRYVVDGNEETLDLRYQLWHPPKQPPRQPCRRPSRPKEKKPKEKEHEGNIASPLKPADEPERDPKMSMCQTIQIRLS